MGKALFCWGSDFHESKLYCSWNQYELLWSLQELIPGWYQGSKSATTEKIISREESQYDQVRWGPYCSYRVPEFMLVEPIFSSLWKQAKFFPFARNRLSSLLSCNSLTTKNVTSHDHLSFQPLSPEALKTRHTTFLGLLGITCNPPDMNAGQLVKAVTLPSAGDNWDMERMENGDPWGGFFKVHSNIVSITQKFCGRWWYQN